MIIVLIELYWKEKPYSSTHSRGGAEEFKVAPKEFVAVVVRKPSEIWLRLKRKEDKKDVEVEWARCTSTFMEDIGGKKSKKSRKEHIDYKGQALKQHESREERLNTLGRKVSGIKLFLRIPSPEQVN